MEGQQVNQMIVMDGAVSRQLSAVSSQKNLVLLRAASQRKARGASLIGERLWIQCPVLNWFY